MIQNLQKVVVLRYTFKIYQTSQWSLQHRITFKEKGIMHTWQ